MSTIEPSLAGPKRPQDRVLLSEVDDQFNGELESTYKKHNDPRVPVEGEDFDFGNGDVAIAAITSCTNTSNPSVLIAAGLVARKAREKGLTSQAMGQDQPRAGKPGGHRLSQRERPQRGPRTRSASTSSATAARPASAIRARCRADQQGDQRQGSGRGQRALAATATSKAACRPTAAPTISPRRRWSSPMRSRAPSAPTWSTSRSAPAATASRCYLKDIWPSNEEIRAPDRRARPFRHVPHAAMPTSITATSAGGRSR